MMENERKGKGEGKVALGRQMRLMYMTIVGAAYLRGGFGLFTCTQYLHYARPRFVCFPYNRRDSHFLSRKPKIIYQ